MSRLFRQIAAGIALATILLTGTLAGAQEATQELRQLLAPSGKLRVGLYPGTPTSILEPQSAQPRGVGFELGKALAEKLGVPYEPIVFTKNAEVLEGVKTGATDIAFTNASPARAKIMNFGQTYLEIEMGYLVPKGSPFKTASEVDAKNIKVGVTQGSTSESILSRDLKNAEVVRIPTLKQGIEMLAAGKIDAYATNKAALFQMSDAVPGSKVLEGHWGLERHAIATPKGRDDGLPFIRAFTADAMKQGLVQSAVSRAGLRGAIVPESK